MKIKRLCLFAHFDAQNEIKEYVVHYLHALSTEADRIIFLTTCRPQQKEARRIRELVSEIIHCDNAGYDFSMWQHSIQNLNLRNWDELLLTNSSVFGPVFPLSETFDAMREIPVDIWGMTDNQEFHWHLQSYFIVFRRSAIASDFFPKFWASVLPFKNKLQTILSYELGLSAYFRENGFAMGAFAPAHNLPYLNDRDTRRRPQRNLKSSPIGYPEELLLAKVPLMKVELFRDNPYKINLRRLRDLLEKHGFNIQMLRYDRPRSIEATRWD